MIQKLSHASRKIVQSPNYRMLPLLHLVLTLLRGIRLYLAFQALSIDVSPGGVLLASALGDLAFLLSITPAALGFREAAIVLAAQAMDTTTQLALSVAVLDRLIFSVTAAAGAQVILAWCVRSGWQPQTPADEFVPSSH